MALKPGTVCGLLGKNGAGKSTLLSLMAGLIFPKAGAVETMHAMPQTRQVEYLQNLYFLPDTFTLPAMDMKQYVACYARFYPHFDKAVYEEALHAFEVKPVKKLADLSYGQQKKFLLAFGVATGAKLMLLDEPTNGLDIPSKQQFRKLLTASFDTDRTFVISTHQVQDIENLVDTVVILDEGQILFNQSVEAIQSTLSLVESVEEPSAQSGFYTKKIPGGYRTLQKNTHDDALVDLGPVDICPHRRRAAA